MPVTIPDQITIPKTALKFIPVGLRIQMLFDLVDDSTYLDIATISKSLGIHHVTVRKTIAELEKKGFLLDRRFKVSGKPSAPIEIRVLPLSQLPE